MTDRAGERLQNFLQCGRDRNFPTSRRSHITNPQGAWHKQVYTRSCNQSAAEPVMITGVDALSITWMILAQARWLRLRFKMMMRQLALWCDGFIHWSPKSSVHIDRVGPRRKISAK
jgi:hypothetical protein